MEACRQLLFFVALSEGIDPSARFRQLDLFSFVMIASEKMLELLFVILNLPHGTPVRSEPCFNLEGEKEQIQADCFLCLCAWFNQLMLL